MTLNSSFEINGFNNSLIVKGCVPENFEPCNLSLYSFESEYKYKCELCDFDSCNYNQGNKNIECYQCSDESSCKNPSKDVCNNTNTLRTLQALLPYYTFDFPNLSSNDSLFSCFSSNTTLLNIPGMSSSSIYLKGCVVQGFQACSLTPLSIYKTTTSKCNICEDSLCNLP